jgi:hypothetical protein
LLFVRIKNKIKFLLKQILAFFIVSFYEPEKWYPVAYKSTRFVAMLETQFIPSRRPLFGLNHATLLNTILSLMTRKKIPFPIPVRARGLEIFEKERPNGVILCSLHIPLCKVALRRLIENGFHPDLAITHHRNKNTSIAVWGITDVIPAIKAGPVVFFKARTILNQGKCLLALADPVFGADISPNLFFLAHRLKSQIIYFLAELMPEGDIEVSFFESAIKDAAAEKAVGAQVSELRGYSDHIINRYQNLKY